MEKICVNCSYCSKEVPKFFYCTYYLKKVSAQHTCKRWNDFYKLNSSQL